MRKNEASRWVANDILKKGNQYRSFGQLPDGQGPVHAINTNNYDNNFVKISQDQQEHLKTDAIRIQKLKMDLLNAGQERMDTPPEMKHYMNQRAV